MDKKPSWTGPRKPSSDNNAQAKGARKGDKDKDSHAINDDITAKEVRLVGDNVEPGIYPIAAAMKIADEQGLDLIEISPNANPPVCRLIDYSKFLYQQKKNYWITAVPATFMSAVSATYFLLGDECLGQLINSKDASGATIYNTAVAYPVGILFAVLLLGIFIYATRKQPASNKK